MDPPRDSRELSVRGTPPQRRRTSADIGVPGSCAWLTSELEIEELADLRQSEDGPCGGYACDNGKRPAGAPQYGAARGGRIGRMLWRRVVAREYLLRIGGEKSD